MKILYTSSAKQFANYKLHKKINWLASEKKTEHF